MPYRLAAIVIHGIGEQQPDFADGFIREVSDRLGGRAEQVCWRSLYWADLLEPRETELLDRLSAGGRHLDWASVRRFVVHFLADAVAYQRVPGKGVVDGTYTRIHARVAERLADLGTAVGGGPMPLLVVAHSLGGHIMSNYIWDQQHPDPSRVRGATPFVRAETLKAMITFGCNIPLFALALPDVVPIDIPHPAGARKPWLNLYDRDDVLGYPLAPLSSGYDAIVEDREVSVGSFLTGWNPLAHNAYWTDNDVTKPIAERISELLV
ncbi:MAG TPA: hypothetical protein VJV78_07855 [Polyangiales bacterium]|nr:hypothetical protein [Polyangiales bacterium]